MKRFRVHIACFGVLLLASLVAGCGTSGQKEGQIGATGAKIVQKGDPVLAGASGYVGSAACKNCHQNQFDGWSKSLHNAPLKMVSELGESIFVNDANKNGINDFKENLDFNSASTDNIINATLKGLRPNAPMLSYSAGKFFIQLGPGGTKFEVQRTQGGNGLWKQRYHTKIGKGYHILPVQYNEKTNQYVNYNEGNWYLAGASRFAGAYTDNNLMPLLNALNNGTDKKGSAVSWENRCSGCHQTGMTLEAQTTNYAGTPVVEAVSGYSELNIGCEACHGPGAAHVASRNPSDIVNPKGFLALGVAGIRQANMVCGSCHSRGEGRVTLAGMSLDTEFPSRFAFGGAVEFPRPGLNVVDNSAGNPFVNLNTASAYYGVVAVKGSTDPVVPSWYDDWYNGFGFTYNFPTYTASKQHHQQWTDLEQGPHGSDKAYDVTCFSCHDPHKAAGDHQIRSTLTEDGVTINTQNDDDTLCLACHAGFDIFSSVTKAAVRSLGNGVVDPALSAAVTAHTHHPFDPTGTKASRCSGCHLPKTAQSAITKDLTAGVKEGDIHNHTFLIIKPDVSKTTGSAPGVNNACMSCHKVGDTRIDPSGLDNNDVFLDDLTTWFNTFWGPGPY